MQWLAGFGDQGEPEEKDFLLMNQEEHKKWIENITSIEVYDPEVIKRYEALLLSKDSVIRIVPYRRGRTKKMNLKELKEFYEDYEKSREKYLLSAEGSIDQRKSQDQFWADEQYLSRAVIKMLPKLIAIADAANKLMYEQISPPTWGEKYSENAQSLSDALMNVGINKQFAWTGIRTELKTLEEMKELYPPSHSPGKK